MIVMCRAISVMTYEIVVSRYREPLTWTTEPLFSKHTYTVYNKGGDSAFVHDRVDNVISLPNVGKDVHTYLYHVVTNYDALSDITVFTPASLDVWYKRDKAATLFHTLESVNFATAVFLGECCSSVRDRFANYVQDVWVPSTAENRAAYTGDSRMWVSPLRPFSRWYEHHFGDQVAEWWSYNNTFAIAKEDVLQYPKSRYERLLEGLSVANDVEEAHYVERSWNAIFGPFRATAVLPYRM